MPARKRQTRKQKQSRRNRKNQSRKNSRRNQRGGMCAAMQNRQAFNQFGGMAPWSTGDSYLLDAPTRVQAEMGHYDAAFAELPHVIPRQSGGRRSRRNRNKKSKKSRRQRSQRSQRQRQRKQRGGMSPFDAPGMLLDSKAYTTDGTNPQFHNEGAVNPSYHQFKGAQ